MTETTMAAIKKTIMGFGNLFLWIFHNKKGQK